MAKCRSCVNGTITSRRNGMDVVETCPYCNGTGIHNPKNYPEYLGEYSPGASDGSSSKKGRSNRSSRW